LVVVVLGFEFFFSRIWVFGTTFRQAFYSASIVGFELSFILARKALCHLSHSSSPFLCWVFSSEGLLCMTDCQGWLQTMILMISASWVARITGMSHWHPVYNAHS
jgi:hypothetical protein